MCYVHRNGRYYGWQSNSVPGRLANQIEVAMDKILPIGVYTSAGAPNPPPSALLRCDSRNEACRYDLTYVTYVTHIETDASTNAKQLDSVSPHRGDRLTSQWVNLIYASKETIHNMPLDP